jgi:hypothetical protein
MDRLSKLRISIPCTKTASTEKIVKRSCDNPTSLIDFEYFFSIILRSNPNWRFSAGPDCLFSLFLIPQ